MPTTHQPEIHPVYVTAYTTADAGRVLTAHQLRTCATALGAPVRVDPVRWLAERSPGVILERQADGSVTIYRAPVARYATSGTVRGWVA
jgi:hypothetical protein